MSAFDDCVKKHNYITQQINVRESKLKDATMRCKSNAEEFKKNSNEADDILFGGILERCRWIFENGISSVPPEKEIKDPKLKQKYDEHVQSISESKRYLEENSNLCKQLKNEIQEFKLDLQYAYHDVYLQDKVEGFDDDQFNGNVYQGDTSHKLFTVIVTVYNKEGYQENSSRYLIKARRPSKDNVNWQWSLVDEHSADEIDISGDPLFRYIIRSTLKDICDEDSYT